MSKPTSWVRFPPGYILNTHGLLNSTSQFFFFSYLYSFSLFSVFKELVARVAEERKNGVPHLPKIGDGKKNIRYSIPELGAGSDVMGQEKVSKKVKAHTVGGRNKLMKILDKTRMSILPQKPYRYTSAHSCSHTIADFKVLKEYKSCDLSHISFINSSVFHINPLWFMWKNLIDKCKFFLSHAESLCLCCVVTSG